MAETQAALPAPRRALPAAGAALLVAGAALVTAGVALAQEPADTTRRGVPDSVAFQLQSLRVEAARPTITSGGASAVEVRLDSLRVPPSPILSEALRAMPLVRVRLNSRGEVQPSLRGMEEREVAVLVDGVPLTVGWDNRTDLSVIPLTAANEVRLVRGLSSLLAGPNALGGVVEVRITGGGFPAQRPPPARFGAALDHTGGLALSGQADHLWRRDAGGTWLRYGAGYRRSDGSALARGLPAAARGEDGLLLNSDLRHANGFLALRLQEGDEGRWLSFSSYGFHARRGVVPELHLLGGPEPEPRFWRIPAQWRSVTTLSAGTEWGDTPWGRGDVEAAIGLDLQRLEIDAFGAPDFAERVDREVGKDRTLSLRLLGDHTLGRGILRGAFTFAATGHEERIGVEAPRDYEQLLWSFGTETEQPLGDRLGPLRAPRLSLGASVDGASTPETGGAPGQPAMWGWGARVSARVAAGFAVLHGGVSRKVRFPALREMFSGALGRFVPNPDLGPVTLWIGELGATVETPGGAEVQATAFQQRLLGSIVRVSVEDGRLQRQNRGETRATGVELLGNVRAAGFALRADLILQRVRLLDADAQAGERPEYQPQVAAGLHAARDVGLGIRAHAALHVTGRQHGVNAETGAFEPLDPSAWLQAGASRRFTGAAGLPPLTVTVAAENLTDEAAFDQLGLPRPGRTVRVQVEVF